MLNDAYAFQQEINARINLRFRTPLEGMSFYQTAFTNVKKMNANRDVKISSWDDAEMLDLVTKLAEEKGYLID